MPCTKERKNFKTSSYLTFSFSMSVSASSVRKISFNFLINFICLVANKTYHHSRNCTSYYFQTHSLLFRLWITQNLYLCPIPILAGFKYLPLQPHGSFVPTKFYRMTDIETVTSWIEIREQTVTEGTECVLLRLPRQLNDTKSHNFYSNQQFNTVFSEIQILYRTCIHTDLFHNLTYCLLHQLNIYW